MRGPQASPRQGSPLPWLSILLASLLAVATLQSEGASRGPEELARTRLTEASNLFDAHRYLTPGPELQAWRAHENLEHLRDAYVREREERGERPQLPGIQRRQQEKLDGLLAEASAALASLPARAAPTAGSRYTPSSSSSSRFPIRCQLPLCGKT